MGTTLLILISACIAIIIFLLIRHILLWYLKIDERINLQERTNQLLEEISEKLESKNP